MRRARAERAVLRRQRRPADRGRRPGRGRELRAAVGLRARAVRASPTSPCPRSARSSTARPRRRPRRASRRRRCSTRCRPPVVGSPITCAPGHLGERAGARLHVPRTRRRAQRCRPGRRPSYTPPAAARGATVSCIVTASSAGGTSTAWSGVSAAVQDDVVPPKAVLRSVRCRKRRCTVKFVAADPNSQGALKVRVTAERRVRARCGKRAPCSKTRSRALKVVHGAGTTATARRRRGSSAGDVAPRPRGRRRRQPAQAGPHEARPRSARRPRPRATRSRGSLRAAAPRGLTKATRWRAA